MIPNRPRRAATLCISLLLWTLASSLANAQESFFDPAVEPAEVPAADAPIADDDGSYTDIEDTDSQEETKDIELQQTDKSKLNRKTLIKAVRRSDSLQGIMREAGLTSEEIYNTLALPTWPKHYVLVPGSRYLISTYKDSPKTELVFFIPRSVQVIEVTKDGGKVDLQLREMNFDIRTKNASGTVRGSLYSSIRNAAGDPWVAMRFLDAYSVDYRLEKQVRRGAKFAITYEEKVLNGQFVAPGELLYTSIEIDGRKQDRYFLKTNEGGGFVALDANHDLRPFYAPIEYFHISSPFNPRRFHPVRRRRIPHRGVDLALAHGSSVFAALEGRVVRVGRSKASGNFVVLEHKNGYKTEYVHLAEVERGINLGVDVKAGMKLGAVGCTGYCTRPHLHFGLTKDGEHLDPVRYVRPYSLRQEEQVRKFFVCASEKKDATACQIRINMP